MTRRKKLFINSIVGLISQITNILCGLILPAAILKTYGSSANGLTNSVSNFLSFISLCELGMGTVVQSSLYKPLAENNLYGISCVLKSSRKFFRIIGMILIIYVFGLCIFYPSLIIEFDRFYVIMMILALSIGSFVNYYFGICNALLLHADQRSYIPLGLQAGGTVINTVMSLAVMKAGASLLVMKYMTLIVFLIRPVLMNIYVKRNYKIDWNVIYTKEPIRQKWNGIAQHIASVVADHTDIVVLTVFTNLRTVSTYSVYFMVVSNIRLMIESSLSGIQAVMGDMFFRKESDALQIFFGRIEWMIHTGIIFLYTVTGILIVPFIKVYTRGVKDANYNVPIFAILIVIAFGGFSLQSIYKLIVKAAGHYRETQFASIMEAAINIVASIILVKKYGLSGVAAGTILAMMFRLLYHVRYIKNNIIFRPYKYFVKHICVDIIMVMAILFLTKGIRVDSSSFYLWIISAIKVSVIAVMAIILINAIFYQIYIKNIIKYLEEFVKKHREKRKGML